MDFNNILFFLIQKFDVIGTVGIVLGIVVLILFLFFYTVGLKNASLFDSVDENEYPLKEIYFVGYGFWNLIGYKFNSSGDEKLVEDLNVLYEARFSSFYLRVVRSQQVTLAFVAFFVGWVLFVISASPMLFFIGPLLGGMAYWYYGDLIHQNIAKRKDSMLSDFAEVVSKLALLTNTGMILRQAWDETGTAGDSIIYQEMRRTSENMNNGVSEIKAFTDFGNRSKLQEVKKFVSLLTQGISKGNAELVNMLRQQSSEIWEIKKQLVLRQGEKAGTKLMAPMMLMFVGILILIVVPMFTNMSFG
jgi:tight adherence protein C